MRRTYNYIFPIAIGAAVILSMFIGYGLYERGQMSFGLLASVGASLLFIAEYVLEVVLVKNRKYGFAIAVSIIKYFVLIIGLMTVFKNALSARPDKGTLRRGNQPQGTVGDHLAA